MVRGTATPSRLSVRVDVRARACMCEYSERLNVDSNMIYLFSLALHVAYVPTFSSVLLLPLSISLCPSLSGLSMSVCQHVSMSATSDGCILLLLCVSVTFECLTLTIILA